MDVHSKHCVLGDMDVRGKFRGTQTFPTSEQNIIKALKGVKATEKCLTLEEERPLKNTPFCPISALRSDFNPRNIQYIPVVKILTRLDLDQNWAFFKGLEETMKDF